MGLEIFNSLERKIGDVVERYIQIREEKRLLEEALKEKESRLNDLENKCKRFERERDTIKAKVENLLKKLETLTSI